MKLMRFPFKRWRSWWLKEHLGKERELVCFTCGNCGAELKKYFDDVLVIGKTGDLIPTRWFTDAEIENLFPDRFDATSGHLPFGYMQDLGELYRAIIGDLDESEVYYVPTGSGETIVSLAFAYPNIRFVAVYNLDDATKYEEYAPLNEKVEEVAMDIIMEGKEHEFEDCYSEIK